MAFNLEEQEQLEQLRDFWARWGKIIVAVVAVVTVAFVAWQGYGWYLGKQSAKASQVYEQYKTAAAKKEASAEALLADLQKNYAKSRYTAVAALENARQSVADGQWDKARSTLQWLVQNGTSDNQAVARLQLVDVLVQTAHNDEAIKTLETVPNAEFTAAFANKKADVYLLMNDNAKARAALEAAIAWQKTNGIANEMLDKALADKLALLPN